MLEELRSDVQDTLRELRELAHGIYPPLLRDRGLPEALQTAANRATLPTTVEADGIGRYPEGVETAVYFCCLEAMQNAGKHAGDGAELTVRVALEGVAASGPPRSARTVRRRGQRFGVEPGPGAVLLGARRRRRLRSGRRRWPVTASSTCATGSGAIGGHAGGHLRPRLGDDHHRSDPAGRDRRRPGRRAVPVGLTTSSAVEPAETIRP